MTPGTWDDTEHNPTWLDCDEMGRTVLDMIAYCKAMQRGDVTEALKHRRLAMFCSEPGLGKSHSMTLFKRHGVRIGLVNPSGRADLCKQFWQRRQEDCGATAFDDVDQPARSEPLISVMKSAWQSGGEGIIRPPGTNAIRANEKRRLADDGYDPTIPPPEFPFTLAHA